MGEGVLNETWLFRALVSLQALELISATSRSPICLQIKVQVALCFDFLCGDC